MEKVDQKPAKEPVFTTKQLATLEQRVEILKWHHANGKNQTKTAKHFDKIYPQFEDQTASCI